MAVVMETGTWTASGSTPQTITLANGSLTPMAIKVRLVRQGAAGAGFVAHNSFAMGFGTRRGGATQSGCHAFVMLDGAAATDCFRVRDTTLLHVLTTTAGGTTDYTITLNAFGAGSFEVAYSSAANASGDVYEYTVWGGLDDARVVNQALTSTGATQAVTGAGFQPNCMLVMGGGLVTANSITQNANFSFGCATSSSQFWTLGIAATDADTCTSAMNWNRTMRTDACLSLLNINLDSEHAAYDLDTWDSDGCTMGILNVPETTTLVSTFLFLKAPAGSFEAGSKTKSSSTGTDTFTLTDSALVVEGILLGTTRSGTGLQTSGIDFCLGAGSTANTTRGSAVNNCSGAATDADAVNPTFCDRYSATDNVIIEPTGGSTPAETSEAWFYSKGTGTFALNWQVNGGSTNTIGYLAIGNAVQNIDPGGVASAEAFGSATIEVDLFVDPSSIASGETFGTATEEKKLDASAIATAETFGSVTVELGAANTFIDPSSVTTAETFGSPTEQHWVNATDIVSTEAFGTPVEQKSLSPSGVATAEQFGSPSEAFFLDTSGVVSGEIFGVATERHTIDPSGVASGEQHGTALVEDTGQAITSAGAIASDEAFGAPHEQLWISTTSAASGEVFGVATEQHALAPTGISTDETFGSVNVVLSLAPTSVPSGEIFGTATLQTFLTTVSIAGDETFGVASMTLALVTIAISGDEQFGTASVQQVVSATGIGSSELFGSASLHLFIQASGAASLETFGDVLVEVADGTIQLFPSGVSSGELFGSLILQSFINAQPATSGELFGSQLIMLSLVAQAVASQEAVGSPAVVHQIGAASVASGEIFGQAYLQQFIDALAIISGEAFGSVLVEVFGPAMQLFPTAIASDEALGSPSLHQTIDPVAVASAELASTIEAGSAASSETFGSALVFHGIEIAPASIDSGEAFGSPFLTVVFFEATASVVFMTEQLSGSVQISSNPARGGLVSASPVLSAKIKRN